MNFTLATVVAATCTDMLRAEWWSGFVAGGAVMWVIGMAVSWWIFVRSKRRDG